METEREAIKDHNRRFFSTAPTIMRGRRVIIQKAGSHYKARFCGHKNFVFGRSQQEAIKNLKFWSTDL